MTGTLIKAVELPDVGTISSLNARREDKEFFYSFLGFVTPGMRR